MHGRPRKRWRGIGTVVSRALSSRAGRVPLLLRQAMLEEKVTHCGASLKLAATGEQDGQVEGIAAGTPR